MATRYFKKVSAKTPLLMTDGAWLHFVPSRGDPYWGYLAVENAYIQEQIDLATKNGVGGITEITLAEYNERNEKKKGWMGLSQPLSPVPLASKRRATDRIHPDQVVAVDDEPELDGSKKKAADLVLKPLSNFRPKATRL